MFAPRPKYVNTICESIDGIIDTLIYTEMSMKKSKKSNQSTEESPLEPGVRPEVVRRRFGKAFPELSDWFEWLNGGYRKGIEWQLLLVAYVRRIGGPRAEQLREELHEAQQMGLKSERHWQVLVCDVLGLDDIVPIVEAKSPQGLLADFEQAMTDLAT